jgi:hypothetical protein
MEDSAENEKPAESTTSPDQTQQPDTAERRTVPLHSGNYENQVFIRKADGMSFEEFRTACKKLFREKGLIKD